MQKEMAKSQKLKTCPFIYSRFFDYVRPSVGDRDFNRHEGGEIPEEYVRVETGKDAKIRTSKSTIPQNTGT